MKGCNNKDLYHSTLPSLTNNGEVKSLSMITRSNKSGSNPKRFEPVTNEVLDDLANNIVTQNTKKQTKWAVKIFRGKFFVLFFHLLACDCICYLLHN